VKGLKVYMNYSELKGRSIVDVNSAKGIGHLEDLVLQLDTREIIGLRIKEGGLFSHTNAISISALQSVGKDALTVQLPVEATSTGKADSSKDTVLEKGPGLNSLINKQVVSQGGKLLGQISDITLDPSNLTITGYEVKEGGLLGKKHSLPESPELTFGPEIVVIPDALAGQFNKAEKNT
jgi:uncharacterized protein YrrD